MQHSPRHLEGLARQIHEETGASAPIDTFALAEACGLTLRPWGKAHAQIDLDAGAIWYPAKGGADRCQFRVGHELAHAVLVRAGERDDDESDVDYLASCLLLPRVDFLRDLGATGWDLFAMKARHPNASHQAIAARMCALSPASATIWDGGKLHSSYGPADPESHRQIAAVVLERGEAVRGELDAWPVFSPGYRRVVCIARAA